VRDTSHIVEERIANPLPSLVELMISICLFAHIPANWSPARTSEQIEAA
jgi:hypothetical protein